MKLLSGFSLLIFCGFPALGATIMPTGGTGGPFKNVTEKGPPGAPMTIYVSYYSILLDSDQPILNPDGSRPQYSFIIPPSGSVTVPIPKTVNGLTVSDIVQITGKPGDKIDPGYLYVGAFGSGPMFGLSDFLDANGEFLLPDFFAESLTSVYYGVNLATIGSQGTNFVNTFSFGSTFTTNASGQIAQLPGYVFSSTPLTYVPGSGWTGTTLGAGVVLDYVAFHDVNSAPEPGTFALAIVAVLLLKRASRRRNSI